MLNIAVYTVKLHHNRLQQRGNAHLLKTNRKKGSDQGNKAAHCPERLYLLCPAIDLGKLELHFVCLFLELVLELLLQ